jgi:hypothetical protein
MRMNSRGATTSPNSFETLEFGRLVFNSCCSRIRATKYAVILDNYLQWNWPPEESIISIEYEGGVEAAYEAVQARKRAFAD